MIPVDISASGTDNATPNEKSVELDFGRTDVTTRAKRAYGTGSIWQEPRNGYRVWIGQVRVAVGARAEQRQRVLGRVRTAGSSDGLTRQMAERALREFRRTAEQEAALSGRRRTDQSVVDVANLHIAQLAAGSGDVKLNTIRDYRSYVSVHIQPFFRDTRIENVSIADIERFISSQRETKGLSSSTVSNHVNFLHSVFAHAMRHEIVDRNPVALAKKPRVRANRRDFTFLSLEEVGQVIDAYPLDHLTRLDRAVVLTAAMTGLRQGELIALRWKDIDFEGAQLTVRASISRGVTGTPKSVGSIRTVPLAQRAALVLEEHRQRTSYGADSDLVFCHPHTGNPYDPSKMRERFYDAMKRAGLGGKVGLKGGGITFHSLRHTFGTHVASAGAPLVAIKEWMGHADIQTTMIYAKWSKDRKAESILLARAFGG